MRAMYVIGLDQHLYDAQRQGFLTQRLVDLLSKLSKLSHKMPEALNFEFQVQSYRSMNKQLLMDSQIANTGSKFVADLDCNLLAGTTPNVVR